MYKFVNVKIIPVLRAILDKNTKHFMSDFMFDIEKIQSAALDEESSKYLLWLSRENGTWCFDEKDVFIESSSQQNTWCYYKEHKNVKAYAIKITGIINGDVYGNLYELDYPRSCEIVKQNSYKDADDVNLLLFLKNQHKQYDKLKEGVL